MTTKAMGSTVSRIGFGGIRGKLVVALLMTALPMVGLVGYFGLEATSNLLRAQAVRNMRDVVRLQARAIEDVVALGAGDVLYRARAPHIIRFARACATLDGPAPELRDTTLAELAALAETHGVYSHVAYIDLKGRERAKVSFEAGRLLVAADDRLGNVGDSRYFRQALQLGPGSVYVSPIHLDREKQTAGGADSPVIILASVVTDGAAPLGVVVVGIDAVPVLPVARYAQAATYIVDAQGWYLFHSEPGLAWSGPENLDTGHNLKSDLGDAADAVLTPVEGVVPADGRIIATRPVALGPGGAAGFMVVCVERPEAALAAEMGDFRRLFWTVMAISFAAPVLAGLALGAFFMRPVRRLRQGVHAVAGGDLTTRVRVRSGDEFQALADDFNEMAERLQEYQRSERAALVGRMARTIIHDIKNPLSTITVLSRLLARADLTEGKRAEAAERVKAQVDRTLMMLQEILEFSRGEGGRIERQELTFEELMSDLRPTLEAQCEENGIELRMDADIECTLSADKTRLQRAISNLTGNACEAMEAGGTLSLISTCSDGWVTIEVLDTGPGLPEAIAGQLTEPFMTYGKQNGTGLGLAITKAIVEAHGGRLVAGNRPEGGARFAVQLPLTQTEETSPSDYVI